MLEKCKFLSILLIINIIFVCENEVFGIMECSEAPNPQMMRICENIKRKKLYGSRDDDQPQNQTTQPEHHAPRAHNPDEKRHKSTSDESYSSEEDLRRTPQKLNQPPLLGQPIVFQDDFPMRRRGDSHMEHNPKIGRTQRTREILENMPLIPNGPLLPGYEEAVRKMSEQPKKEDESRNPHAHIIKTGWDEDPEFMNPDGQNYTIVKELKGNYTSDAWMCKNLTCLCPYFDGKVDSTTNVCILPSGKPLLPAVRKEYRMLTDKERKRYHWAVKTLMEDGIFDELSALHLHIAQGNEAHTGPNFWPWHRGYLKRFEIELRKLDPDLAIPYWDSTLDQILPNSHDSIMWTADFMGEIDANGTVINGPAAHYTTLSGKPLRRRAKFGGALFHENDIRFVMGESQVNMPNQFLYMDIKKNFHCAQQLEFLEIMHGDPHHYVGGDMEDLPTATNDPIFFLHHCFVDLIWELWRQQKDPQCHVPGLVDSDTDTTYIYAPRPTCSHEYLDCGSKNLFCVNSRREPRCAVKIKEGGLCKGLDSLDMPCWDGFCRVGKCISAYRKSPSKIFQSETLVPEQSLEEADIPEAQEALNLINFATHLRRNILSKDDYKLYDDFPGSIPRFYFAA